MTATGPPPTEGGLAPTGRTTLRRRSERGSFDLEVVNAILDEGLVCHLGLAADGYPVVIPTTYARIGRRLYLHGAPANRALRHLASGADACLTVTLLDGLVLARSAFHHSMNYRSVVIFGRAEPVQEPDEKRLALTALLDHMAPGRSLDARPPSPEELRKTLVLRMEISEGSAKIRSGGPIEEPEDMSLPVWAGEVPLRTVAGAAITDDGGSDVVAEPAYVSRLTGGRSSPRSAS